MSCRPLTALLLPVLLASCGDDGGGGDGFAIQTPLELGKGRRNVVVISMDTTRADHIGAYGYPLDITPNVDALAARGVRFANAYAPMPQTLPSHTSLFTGMWPRQHGTLENVFSVEPAVVTMAEVFRDLGYRTGAVIGALALHNASGIDAGFEFWDQPGGDWIMDVGHPPEQPADVVTDKALGWADGLSADEPYLLFAHYYDPHGPFEAPAKHLKAVPVEPVLEFVKQKKLGNELAGLPKKLTNQLLTQVWHGYAAELRFTDAQIGRLLAGLAERGLMDDTIVVLVGDHGEGLYEHGQKAHGVAVWEEMHRIPMIFAHPDGTAAGTVVEQRVSLRDVLPSLASMATDTAQERSDDLNRALDLWDLVVSGDGVPDRPIFLERPHYSKERADWRGGKKSSLVHGEHLAVLDGSHKLIREADGTIRLFDLATDPAEQVDLARREPVVLRKLDGLLNRWRQDWPVGVVGSQDELSDERKAALEALGYLGGDAESGPVTDADFAEDDG